jgi:hypothetical protein
MVGMAMLTGCATLAPIDKSLPIGRPSKFNSDPARYDHKAVYIRAYLATSNDPVRIMIWAASASGETTG